jgi:hypothetical protein
MSALAVVALIAAAIALAALWGGRRRHFFIHGNLVFATGPDDVWAAYRLDGESYPGLSSAAKVELKDRLEGFAYAVETDFMVMRVAREWSTDLYAERARATVDRRRGDPAAFERLLAEHRERLEGRRVVRPETYLFVRLGPPLLGAGLGVRLRELGGALRRSVGMSEARAISGRRLAALRLAEERLHERIYDYIPCERCRSGHVARLIRSAYTRGLGEPPVDENWRPQALLVEAEGEDGEACFEPYEHDLLRLHGSRVEVGRRFLRIESELGTAHQALLVVGALPEESVFPSADVELMFTPLEVGFPVDAIFSAEYLPNRGAQRLAQKRMVDADQQAKEEAHGEHGPSFATQGRTYAARELQERLAASDRPPLLRSALTLCVGADSADELERRCERLRKEFGRIELHRPAGDQYRLFCSTLPAQRFGPPEYRAHLLPEQFAAMVPTATSHAGSEIGPYVGYALTGSHAPVQFDVAEACRQNRPPTMLLTGSLGSGKTIALEAAFLWPAFLQGSAPIVDVDPKGDHHLDRLPGVREAMEVIELGPEERFQGLLDPFRVADPAMREDLAYSFLSSILPAPVPAPWQTEIRRACGLIAKSERPCTGDVLGALAGEGEAARGAARALEVHLGAGLARLGFGTRERRLPDPGDARVISIRIRNLVLPEPGTGRGEFQEDERIGQAVMNLLAAYALWLCASDPRRHSVFALDEAWTLLASTYGRSLLARASRLGRSQALTPILASQIVGDAAELEPLVGSYFAFGVETAEEAARALSLLRLDADDRALRQRLIGFRQGRCYFRDFDGHTVPMRIDPGAELLRALDTTPDRRRASGRLDDGEPEGERDAGGLAA